MPRTAFNVLRIAPAVPVARLYGVGGEELLLLCGCSMAGTEVAAARLFATSRQRVGTVGGRSLDREHRSWSASTQR